MLNRDVGEVATEVADIAGGFYKSVLCARVNPKPVEELGVSVVALLLLVFMFTANTSSISSRGQYAALAAAENHIPTSITRVSPKSGTTLGSTQVFEWNAVRGVSDYLVTLGAKRGGTEIFSHYTDSTAVTIENIPQDKKNVYLRIMYNVGTRTKYKDVGYRTRLVTTVPSFTITYPKGGENMVTGDPMLIRWTPTVQVSAIEIVSTVGNYSFGIYGPKYGNNVPITSGEYTYYVVNTTPAGTYYVRITPADGGAQAVSRTFTINQLHQQPSITISNSSLVPPQSIAVNVPTQILGGFEVTNNSGEPVSLKRTAFNIGSSEKGILITNATMVDKNNAVVAGPVDGVSSSLIFTDTVTFPSGKRPYIIKGTVNNAVNGQTVMLLANPAINEWSQFVGQTTGKTYPAPNALFEMSTMTVRAGALSISLSSNPQPGTIVPGTVGFIFANYLFDASQSVEDVRFNTVRLELNGTSSATGNPSHLSGCQLFDATIPLNTGSNIVNPSSNGDKVFTLDSYLVVPKGTIKPITLRCNVLSSATGRFQWGITAGQILIMQVVGVPSGIAITPTGTTNYGPLMTTISSGTLSFSTDPASSPSYSIATGGSSGVTSVVARFRATGEAINLSRIVLKLGIETNPSDLIQAYIYDGSTQVGTAVFTGTNKYATSTLISSVFIPKESEKKLTIKMDLSSIGVAQAVAESGHLVKVNIEGWGTQGIGVVSGMFIQGTGAALSNGVRVYKSYPTFALDQLPGAGVADGRLLRFKVSANNAGAVGIAKFSINISPKSATVSNVNIYGYNDPSYSQPISGVNTGGALMTTNQQGLSLAIYPQISSGSNTVIQVPAGQTRYFEVRGTVIGSGPTYFVTTLLRSESYYAGVNPASGIDVISNLLWSPNSTTTAALSDFDWTNSYALPGLPSTGIMQTRTN